MVKKILFLLMAIGCFLHASAQIFLPDNKYGTQHLRSQKDSIDIIPKGLTGSNNGKRTTIFGKDTAQIRYNIADSSVYVHTGFDFRKIGGGVSTNIYTADGILTGNRQLTGLNNTYYLAFDSLDYWRMSRNGVTRIYANNATSSLYSPDGNTLLNITNGLTQLSISSASNYFWGRADSFLVHKRISYEGNIHSTFYDYSLVDKSYVDSVVSAGGGSSRFGVSGEDDAASTNRAFELGASNSFNIARTATTGTGLYILGESVESYSQFDATHFADIWGKAGATASNLFVQLDVRNGSDRNTLRVEADSTSATDRISYKTNINGSLEVNSLVTKGYVDSVSGGGGTPTLQQVTDVGFSTTNPIESANYIFSGNLGTGKGVTVDGGTPQIVITNSGIKDGRIKATNLTIHHNYELPDTPNSTDTLATLEDVRAGGGGGAVDTNFVVSKLDRQKLLDSLQAAGWGPTNIIAEERIKYWADMSGSTQANFYAGGNLNTVFVGLTPFANWMGGRKLGTSTSTTGGAYLYFGNIGGYSPIAFDSFYRYNYESIVRLEDLSDGTETFTVIAGFGDEANLFSSNVDGAGFRYTHSDSSGAWIAWTKSNSTITEDATSITVAADTDYLLKITTIEGVAYFYIDDILRATISTNVPTGTARATSSVTFIKKSAGTTERLMYVERLGIGKQTF